MRLRAGGVPGVPETQPISEELEAYCRSSAKCSPSSLESDVDVATQHRGTGCQRNSVSKAFPVHGSRLRCPNKSQERQLPDASRDRSHCQSLHTGSRETTLLYAVFLEVVEGHDSEKLPMYEVSREVVTHGQAPCVGIVT